MKKILLLLILLIIITGCNKKYILSVNEKNSLEYNLFYKNKNGQKIYSTFKEIKYNNNGNYINLQEALEQKLISIDYIISKMHYKDTINDGGSMIYEYTKKSNDLSTSSFIVVKCNTILDNNQNIIIGKYYNIVSKCHEKSE